MYSSNFSSKRWRVVFACTAGIALGPGTIIFYLFSIFIEPIQAEFGWGRGDISLSLTISTAASVLSIPFAGMMIDRFGVRRILIPSLLLLGAGLNSFQWINSLSGLYACFATTAVVAAGTNSVSYIRALCTWFESQRGLVIGIASSGMGLGLVVLSPIAGYLLKIGDWRLAYSGLGWLVWLVGVPIVYTMLHENDQVPARGKCLAISRRSDSPVSMGISPYSARQAFSSVRFWHILIAFLFITAALNAVAAHLVPLLLSIGEKHSEAVLAISVLGMTMTIGRLLTGYIIDKIFAPHVAAFLFLGSMTGIFILVSGIDGTVPIIAAISLIGFCLGAELDLLAYLLSRYFGLQAFGTIYGLGLSVFLGGASVGPYLMGASFDATGSYETALHLCGASILVGIGLMLLLRPFPRFGDNYPT